LLLGARACCWVTLNAGWVLTQRHPAISITNPATSCLSSSHP